MGYSDRLRQAIRLTDPLHTALRWRGGLTSRRPYSALWHIGRLNPVLHMQHTLFMKIAKLCYVPTTSTLNEYNFI